MTVERHVVHAAVLALAAAAAGCPRTLPAPKVDVAGANELRVALEASEARRSALVGEARVRVTVGGKSNSFNLFVAVEAPARVHLEPLDFFGRPLGVWVSDGARFGWSDVREGRYYTGPLRPDTLERFLGIALPSEDLPGLLLGRVPRAAAAVVSFTRVSDGYQLVLGDAAAQIVLDVWAAGPCPKRLAFVPERYRAAWGEPELREGVAIPGPLELRLQGGAEATLRFTDLTLETPAADAFVLEPPPGARVVNLDEKS